MVVSAEDINSYSPDGRIYQLEYAMTSMKLGTSTIGYTTNNLIILCSEKKILNKSQIASSISKHFTVYDNCIMAYSGITGDAKCIYTKLQQYFANFESMYGEKASIVGAALALCKLALKFGEKDWDNKILSRPFGASIMIGGIENNKPMLVLVDGSGSYYKFKYKAMGNAVENVEDELEKVYDENDDEEVAVKKVIKIMGGVMKDEISKENVELTVVNGDNLRFYSENELQLLIDEVFV